MCFVFRYNLDALTIPLEWSEALGNVWLHFGQLLSCIMSMSTTSKQKSSMSMLLIATSYASIKPMDLFRVSNVAPLLSVRTVDCLVWEYLDCIVMMSPFGLIEFSSPHLSLEKSIPQDTSIKKLFPKRYHLNTLTPCLDTIFNTNHWFVAITRGRTCTPWGEDLVLLM